MTCTQTGNVIVCTGTVEGKPRHRFLWCFRCKQKAWRRSVLYAWYGWTTTCMGLRRRMYAGRPTKRRAFYRCGQRWESE